jgi:hypothetical protein
MRHGKKKKKGKNEENRWQGQIHPVYRLSSSFTAAAPAAFALGLPTSSSSMCWILLEMRNFVFLGLFCVEAAGISIYISPFFPNKSRVIYWIIKLMRLNNN